MVLMTASLITMGVMLDCCVPVRADRGDPEDRELMHVREYLRGLSECEDAHLYNK